MVIVCRLQHIEDERKYSEGGKGTVKDTFRGGVHPRGHKELSREMPLRAYEATGEMVFPLAQHIGKPAKAIVKKGDPVVAG